MPEMITIAVDAMGGDNAPSVVLDGVAAALDCDANLSVILCGATEVVKPFAEVHERCSAQVATEIIEMGEPPARAVRKKRDSSIVVGCRLVRERKAQGFFSIGSTGACLAAGTLVMGRSQGVLRPALATVLPSPKGPVVLCDVGANADCKPEYLVQFAKMASVYAEKIVGIKAPRTALLNIGEEEEKGSQFAQEAHKLLRVELSNFEGNVEGRDILSGEIDVIVCDGFTGNVCLKTIEGTTKMIFSELKKTLTASPLRKLGAAVIKGGLHSLVESINPDTYGGAPLLGVKGACIVGHGSSQAIAVQNGILTTAATVRQGVSEVIAQTVKEFNT